MLRGRGGRTRREKKRRKDRQVCPLKPLSLAFPVYHWFVLPSGLQSFNWLQQAAEAAEFEAQRAAEAAAELDKWKDMFQVETEGTVEEDVQEQSQGLLHEFVEYIKVRLI